VLIDVLSDENLRGDIMLSIDNLCEFFEYEEVE